MNKLNVENGAINVSYSTLSQNQLQILGLLRMANYLEIVIVEQYTDIDTKIILDEIQKLNSVYRKKESGLINILYPDPL